MADIFGAQTPAQKATLIVSHLREIGEFMRDPMWREQIVSFIADEDIKSLALLLGEHANGEHDDVTGADYTNLGAKPGDLHVLETTMATQEDYDIAVERGRNNVPVDPHEIRRLGMVVDSDLSEPDNEKPVDSIEPTGEFVELLPPDASAVPSES